MRDTIISTTQTDRNYAYACDERHQLGSFSVKSAEIRLLMLHTQRVPQEWKVPSRFHVMTSDPERATGAAYHHTIATITTQCT